MSIGIKIPGAGPGTGPVIPPALYSFGAGLDDYTHRFDGSRLEGAVGSVPSKWEDSVASSVPLVLGLPAYQVAETGGARFLKKVAGQMGSSSAGPRVPYDSAGTLVGLLYVDPTGAVGGTRYSLNAMGGQIGRASNGSWQWSAPGGYSLASNTNDAWEFVAMAHDGSAPFTPGEVHFQRGSTFSTGLSGTATPTGYSTLTVTSVVAALEAGYQMMAYWPRKLSPTEINTVRAAIMANTTLF